MNVSDSRAGVDYVGASYVVGDGELPTGSTFGGPKACIIVKATGALNKVYSIDAGEVLFGTLVVHHWDERTGIRLRQESGTFTIHPEHQVHDFTLSNGVAVQETVFVLSGPPDGERVDPPAAYFAMRLRNDGGAAVNVGTYAFCELRGEMPSDVLTAYDARRNGFVAWNAAAESTHVRVFGCSQAPTSYVATTDVAFATARKAPGPFPNTVPDTPGNPLGVLHLAHALQPGESVEFAFTLSFSSEGRAAAERTYDACPPAADALERTKAHYNTVLTRSIVRTPDKYVNRGVLWAKANMLRTQLCAPTGWSFVNDPTRSNNSVGRDTAWFAYGADYVDQAFARASLLAYVERQEPSGMIVEYYDVRNGKAADYGLNVNDNTPLLVLALWHHYNATGDDAFLRSVYPAAVRAARFLLSQRNEELGLVWCTSTKTSDWGIVGWRNVIQNYRLSGATTELNSECFAALRTVASMAQRLGNGEDATEFGAEADALRAAIEQHLVNPNNGLYYLNIDVDGTRRSDITSDLVFPVIFGVADDERAARVVSALGHEDFWTNAGIRTVPRDAPGYGPTHGYGLLGGVWVGVSFWYAFAAARYNAGFMAHALSISFRHYALDPRRHNTVPGQFSEWLHGETLANQGMMLSPWFPPRYVWAAIEGALGLHVDQGHPTLAPQPAPDWQWLAARNVPYKGGALTWFTVRMPELRSFGNAPFEGAPNVDTLHEDISAHVDSMGQEATAFGLRDGDRIVLFVGNVADVTITTALRLDAVADGRYRGTSYNALRGGSFDVGPFDADELRCGVPLEIERKGFVLLDLRRDA